MPDFMKLPVYKEFCKKANDDPDLIYDEVKGNLAWEIERLAEAEETERVPFLHVLFLLEEEVRNAIEVATGNTVTCWTEPEPAKKPVRKKRAIRCPRRRSRPSRF